MSKNIALKILEHPDKDEIITKLLSSVPVADIHEWLVAKGVSVACISRVGLEAGALSNWLCPGGHRFADRHQEMVHA